MRVSEVTVKTLANYLKLDYESLGEEEILELAAFLQAAVCFIFCSSDKSQVIICHFPNFFGNAFHLHLFFTICNKALISRQSFLSYVKF